MRKCINENEKKKERKGFNKNKYYDKCLKVTER